jgi:hypothetical protein
MLRHGQSVAGKPTARISRLDVVLFGLESSRGRKGVLVCG